MELALELVQVLRAAEVAAPTGLPCAGFVVNFDIALRFVARFRRMARERGHEAAVPRITFHWTAEENFWSIVEKNLMVPDGQNVKRKHGAALGRGVYTCPDFRFAKEDFSYGARACFLCLALVGRQQERLVHGGQKDLGVEAGFDSVKGRLPGRYVDTWVLPESDLLLPCFLVDELALRDARLAAQAAIKVLQERGQEEAQKEDASADMKSQQQSQLDGGPALLPGGRKRWQSKREPEETATAIGFTEDTGGEAPRESEHCLGEEKAQVLRQPSAPPKRWQLRKVGGAEEDAAAPAPPTVSP